MVKKVRADGKLTPIYAVVFFMLGFCANLWYIYAIELTCYICPVE
nr:MAG TPA: hypothetical protein [Caudoviricetes sp.]